MRNYKLGVYNIQGRHKLKLITAKNVEVDGAFLTITGRVSTAVLISGELKYTGKEMNLIEIES